MEEIEKYNTQTALSKTTSESLVVLPREQVNTYNWMATRLMERRFDELALGVPDSVEKCMKAPSVITMVRGVGKERVREFLSARIIWLIAQMNVAHTMTTPQKNFAIDTLLDRYPHETLADFALVFKRMAQGYYGSTYHQLDTAIIMNCMAQHIEEKAMFLERDQTTAKEQAKKEESGPDYNAFRKRLEQKQKEAEQEKAKAREQRIQELQGYENTLTPAQLQTRELKRQWMEEVIDTERSTITTYRQKKGAPSFEQWLKNKSTQPTQS
jgi:hypothetical protein